MGMMVVVRTVGRVLFGGWWEIVMVEGEIGGNGNPAIVKIRRQHYLIRRTRRLKLVLVEEILCSHAILRGFYAYY
jgi:hypothetical protein